jgi:hypothetical protein
MRILTRAIVEQTAAKIAAFGPGGSGKSLTLILIALALSKMHHKGAPIVIQDTEGRASDWLVPLCDLEGVELHRIKSRSFTDMRRALTEAEEIGACAFICDSYTHPWGELQKALKKRLNVKKLEFVHMQELQETWGEWVDQFLNSPLHVLLSGRLAYEWENDVDLETGKVGFHKAGTKIRSEKDAGYEPHLLIEMESTREMGEVRETKKNGKVKRTRTEKKAGGTFTHKLHVLKDRGRELNGKSFDFKDINNYKAGDWKPVYQALLPHFSKIRIGGQASAAIDTQRTSDALFSDRGDTAYANRVKRVRIVLEEIDGTLTKLWPGMDAKSKALKALAIETVFNTRSWTAVEALPLEILDQKLDVLTAAEERIVDGGEAAALTDAAALIATLTSCLQKVKAEAEHAEQTIGIL